MTGAADSLILIKLYKQRRNVTTALLHMSWGRIFTDVTPPLGDCARRGCRGEPSTAGRGVRSSAERHTPAGAAAVAVAGPDPWPDRHPGGHAAAAASGHTAAGMNTRANTHKKAINTSVSVHPSAARRVNTARLKHTLRKLLKYMKYLWPLRDTLSITHTLSFSTLFCQLSAKYVLWYLFEHSRWVCEWRSRSQ